MIADAKNLQVSGKCRYSSWCQLFPTTRRLKPQVFISMCAGESNPTPLAIMEKTRHPSAPAVLTSTASPSAVKRPDTAAKKQHFLHRNFWRLPGRKWESVPIAFGKAKHKIKQSAFPCVLVVTRLRQRCRAAPLFWPSHRPVSQNMELL